MRNVRPLVLPLRGKMEQPAVAFVSHSEEFRPVARTDGNRTIGVYISTGPSTYRMTYRTDGRTDWDNNYSIL